jgi:hypothetical protein
MIFYWYIYPSPTAIRGYLGLPFDLQQWGMKEASHHSLLKSIVQSIEARRKFPVGIKGARIIATYKIQLHHKN